jgi:hypothetical protein
MLFGQMVHALLLGVGKYEVIDANDFRTKTAQARRDLALTEGRTPILRSEFSEAESVVGNLQDRLAEMGIRLNGKSELDLEWDETVDGVPSSIPCRGRLDHLTMDSLVIYDLKTTSSAHPDNCVRSICDYGYDIQRAAYVSAVEHRTPDVAGRIDYVLLFVETEEPYCVTPLRLDGRFVELGERKWRRALRVWHECITNNRWPEYVTEITTVSPPTWELTKEMSV